MQESECKRIRRYALRAIAPSMTEPPEYRHVHMTDFADLAGQAYFSHCFNFRPHRGSVRSVPPVSLRSLIVLRGTNNSILHKLIKSNKIQLRKGCAAKYVKVTVF